MPKPAATTQQQPPAEQETHDAHDHAAMQQHAATSGNGEATYSPPPLTDADRAAAFPLLHGQHVHGDPLVWMVQADRFEYTQGDALAWSGKDETLRLLCTFELDPPAEKLARLHDTLNRTNDMVWGGGFTFWNEQKLMVWRYGLVLAGGQSAGPEQIDRMISQAVTACERFYPAFQLVCWGDDTPERALRVAIAEAYGRA